MLYQTINTNKLQKTSYISFHCTSFIIIIVILKKLSRIYSINNYKIFIVNINKTVLNEIYIYIFS